MPGLYWSNSLVNHHPPVYFRTMQPHTIDIQNRIVEIRGQRVILDFDLANLYDVETKALNQAVKRNADRFPGDFMFRLSQEEWDTMRSQNVTASAAKRNLTATPFAFTEHGVSMLAAVLRSRKAVTMNIAIIRAFISLRHFISRHNDFARQLEEFKKEIDERFSGYDTQLNAIYEAIENLLDESAGKQTIEERKRIGFKAGS